MTLAVLEGIVMCFVLLIICVVGIANGPVGMVFFYERIMKPVCIGHLRSVVCGLFVLCLCLRGLSEMAGPFCV